MPTLLGHNRLFVKEQVRFFRISNVYDIYDQNQNKLGQVKERTNLLKKVLRKYELGFYDTDGRLLFSARKPFAFIKQKFFLYDENNRLIGNFYKKIVAVMPQFFIYNNQGDQIGLLKGDFFAWNFQIIDNNKTNLAVINKIFSGGLREIFTSADSYQIMIHHDKTVDRRLLIAAPFIVDMIMKEQRGKRSVRVH
ncbi:LURP-one-related family protein [Candidatus Woesearchaeota archaeon]|nr:LURP-one-related family protein [Candidatus Woesearchaeota archaeon]